MFKKLFSIAIVAITLHSATHAQGMWIPSTAVKDNFAEMQSMGLRLSGEEVYAGQDKVGLEDAIIRLNGGNCSAEFISSQGLVLTNHHCGYDGVASLSSVGSDFLTKGFWAFKFEEELPIPDYYVSLLERIEDVTEQVRDLDPAKAQGKLMELAEKAKEGGKYTVDIKAMYAGNEFFLYVYRDYKDVRMVGAPPSSIGKFGGDTDNWMWPRHTGDFTMLRVYADKNNEPAEYSKDNVPFKPKKYLPVSLKGIQESDYAMIMGCPGSTDRYQTSDEIQFAMEKSNGAKIEALGKRLEVMKKYMDKNDTIRIALASNYASLANTWKYFIGQTTMLKRHRIPDVKREEEKAYQAWANGQEGEYKNVIGKIAKLHEGYDGVDKFVTYTFYGLLGASGPSLGRDFVRAKQAMEKDPKNVEGAKAAAAKIAGRLPEWKKEFFPNVDKEIVWNLLTMYKNNVRADLQPAVIAEILASKAAAKGKTDEEKFRLWTEWAYSTSVVTNAKLRDAFLAAPTLKAIEKDPIVALSEGVVKHFREKLLPGYQGVQMQLEELHKVYIDGLRKANPDRKFYPDANSSIRLTYGKVRSYDPQDAVHYDYMTTVDGLIAKENNNDPEFIVPERLHQLWAKKDYGQYAMPDGRMPVCFLTTNDITGGNSGSAVINADGEIIGCAFDGNWEAMAGDIHVFPNLNRTIAVDIRYVLFIVEKYAGAMNLINEMEIRK